MIASPLAKGKLNSWEQAVLTPRGYPFGPKRLCVDSNYFETFNRSDVELVSVQGSAFRITEAGVDVGGRDRRPCDRLRHQLRGRRPLRSCG